MNSKIEFAQITLRAVPMLSRAKAKQLGFIILLFFLKIFWCCERGLNSRPLPYQGSALPLSYGSFWIACFCHIEKFP